MSIGNRTAAYPRPRFTEPTSHGYIYVGTRADPPRRTPFVRRSAQRDEVLRRYTKLARHLDVLAEVVAATVYEAVLIPPVPDGPRFDVILLIETTSPEAIAAVSADEEYRRLDADLVMPARNIRRIGDIDSPRSGTFLFNHFTADDPDHALRTWEEIAGWFTEEAGVADSALLRPVHDASYVFVNHVRLPCGPVRFLLRFAKPSFHRFVAKSLKAGHIGNAPVICRPVHTGEIRP